MSLCALVPAIAFALGLAVGLRLSRGNYSVVRLQVTQVIRRDILDVPVAGNWQTELAKCLENIEAWSDLPPQLVAARWKRPYSRPV